MKGSFWRSVVIICLVQGLATALSPNAGMLAGGLIAIYLVGRLLFVEHPAVWWNNLLFFAVSSGIALLGAGVFALTCAALPLAGFTTRSCRVLSFERAILLHLWMLCLIGGIFWFSLRFWLWWRLRCVIKFGINNNTNHTLVTIKIITRSWGIVNLTCWFV